MSLNSVNIMGNLTRDPEIRYTSSGRPVCNMAIANNRVYTKNGERVKEVSYFDVEVWGPAAENCAKYLAKGRGIVVEGRLKQDRWEKEGRTQSRVRISANSVHFLPGRPTEGSGASREDTGATMSSGMGTSGASPEGASSDSVAWDE